MATIFSRPPIIATTTATTAAVTITSKPLNYPRPQQPRLTDALTAAIAAATILTTSPTLPASPAEPSYRIYYGTAASAANYGGYGGNSDPKASAEYIYDVPAGWKERPVSKVQKGTNGTDSEFYNPRKRSEREYLTFLSGFRSLAPRDVVLNNLALSDVDLQDLIAGAESLVSEEKKDENGQVYYVFDIEGIGKHSLISVTCAKNKMYAHFVNAPAPEWKRDQETLRHLHDSFKTVTGSTSFKETS